LHSGRYSGTLSASWAATLTENSILISIYPHSTNSRFGFRPFSPCRSRWLWEYSRLETYENTLDIDSMLILTTDSELFKCLEGVELED
jgi:hypothetical protein